ncbi:glycosyltransferase family 4 protein [Patescibacteria group bacterium]
MKIGIDARMYGLEHAGIGRYVINLVNEAIKIDRKNQYVLFLRKKYFSTLDVPRNTTKVLADIRHYSLDEQTKFPQIMKKQCVDLMHFPHFNVPLIYNEPYVVTIHDLLWHQVKGMAVTSLSPLKYLVKYLGYRSVVNHAISKANNIIVPSKYVKSVVEEYGGKSSKIVVTHEAVDDSLKKTKKISFKKLSAKYNINKPFVIYIGSAYPHKNVNKLIDAINLINHQSDEKIQLIVAGSRDIFVKKLQQYAEKTSKEKNIIFTGYLTDNQVKCLYQNALCLVHPSLSEGFGLTGLEAMSVGLPVISSDAGSLKEIYQDAALYIDPHSSYDLSYAVMTLFHDKKLRQKLIKAGKKQATKYSWEKMVKKTIKTYKKAISIKK